jgi:hypothetical protein
VPGGLRWTPVVQGLVIGGMLALLVNVLLFTLGAYLPAVSDRVWPIARIAIGGILLSLGVLLLVKQSNDLVATRCVITDVSVAPVEDDDGRFNEVWVRVRWKAGARNLRLHRPLALDRFPSHLSSPAELEKRFAPGREVACAMKADNPTRITLNSPEKVASQQSAAVVALLLAGGVVAAVGFFTRRRSAVLRRTARARSRTDTIGRIAMILLGLAGMVLINTGWLVPGVLLLVAGVTYLVVVSWREVKRTESGLARVRARLEGEEEWPASDEENSDERVTGLWSGHRVWVAMENHGPLIRVALERWPEGIAVDAGTSTTGDPAFDEALALHGDERAWRPAMTEPVRKRLMDLVARRGGAIDPDARHLELRLADVEADRLPQALDDAVGLAVALPAERTNERFLRRLAGEPMAAVRLAGYRLLVASGWEVPVVLRQAAADPDPEVAAWARAQLPPDGGAYR